MKHYPLVDLIHMMMFKPTMSIHDFAEAFAGSDGKKEDADVTYHENLQSFKRAIS